MCASTRGSTDKQFDGEHMRTCKYSTRRRSLIPNCFTEAESKRKEEVECTR